MKRIKFIVRGSLLLLIAVLLINLYRKTDNNLAKIAKFKFDTFNKIQSDTSNAQHKLNTLVEQTSKFNKEFIEDAPDVKSGLRYVMAVVGLLAFTEIGFYVAGRKNSKV